MGTINIVTNLYEYPIIANKKNKYKCPGCEKNVIFRNGKIKKPHFAHNKSNTPCCYYDKPSESQIHKDAKLLMKTLLNNKNIINFYKTCITCNKRDYHLHITLDKYTNAYAIEEYRFHYNNSNRSADVALVENNNNIKIIFEIFNSSKTKDENRPEPWVEINAGNLIKDIHSSEIIKENGNIDIECIRCHTCQICIEKKIQQQRMYIEEMERKRQKQIEEIERKRQKQIEDEIKEKKLIKEQYILEQERNRQHEKNAKEWMKQQYMLEQERKRRIKHDMQIDELFTDLGYDTSNNEKCSIKCKCDFCICSCMYPNYKLSNVNNSMYCSRCNNWKCRCSV